VLPLSRCVYFSSLIALQHLDDDGIVAPGEPASAGDVLVNKYVPVASMDTAGHPTEPSTYNPSRRTCPAV
jgi:DNA-directed RNA polymerase beta subunit